MRRSRITPLLLILALAYPATETLGRSLKAREIVKKMQAKYKSLRNLQADFEQIYVWDLAGETTTSSGTIYLKDTDQYYIETELQKTISDGTTIWTYSKADSQVIIDRLTTSEKVPLMEDLILQFTRDFSAQLLQEETLNNQKTYLLQLIPKDEDEYIRSMKIWVDAKTWLALKIEQIDINDNTNTYTFSSIRENVHIQDDLFTFKIPGDIEVVDLRENE